ncbi:MAG: UbiA family prenyltransferase [Candidatus Micrarchaeota archaeon]|nr:UbiA family prenyltransferase [Candidatus Micrarchaeota archaeon]
MLSAYARLFRIEHAFMLSFAVLLAFFARGAFPQWQILLAALAAPFFIEMGSFALNDYFDVETDLANRRKDRPIASGEIRKENALFASAICYAAGIFCLLLLPIQASAIGMAFTALSVAYNAKLKDLPVAGNAYIAASMAVPFVFGDLVVSSQPSESMLAIASVAFFAGFGREIAKSIEDAEGDAAFRKSKTLPVVLGKAASAKLAAGSYAAAVLLSPLPFALGLKANTLSLGMVAIAAISFAYLAKSLLEKLDKESLESSRKASLLSLAIGLAGYAASVI